MCGSAGTRCSAFSGTEVVFVGRVIRASESSRGTPLAHLAVEEIFHGLSANLREIDVDTLSGTGCYIAMARGDRWIVYASRDQKHPALVHLARCSLSFNIRGNELALEALRSSQMGKPGSIAGKVWVFKSPRGFDSEAAPEGVTVVAESAGVKHTAATTSSGEFLFGPLPPGPYKLSVVSDRFLDFPTPLSGNSYVQTTEQECGYGAVYTSPNGSISGRITAADGTPIQGISVQGFAVNLPHDPKFEMMAGHAVPDLDRYLIREAKTNDSGDYLIQGLPPADYVVGVNAEKNQDTLPYPPIVFPGKADFGEGARIHLEKFESRAGIDLRLAPPRESAVLLIDIIYPDGSAATPEFVSVENEAGDLRFSSSKVHHLDVYRGETYRIRASCGSPVGRTGHREWEGVTGLVTVDAPEKRVEVVVHRFVR